MRSAYGLDTDPSEGWRLRAACQGVDPELFFSEARGTSRVQALDEAKAVCRRCPVTAECLAWAVQIKAVDGVWGGTSEDERAPLMAETRACGCGQRFVPRMGHQTRCRTCLDAMPRSVKPGVTRVPCPVCERPIGVAWGRVTRHVPPGGRLGDPVCPGSTERVVSA